MRLASLLLIGVMACGDDGGAGIDAMPPDSDPACGGWTVVPAAGANLRLYDPSPVLLGRTVRVAFDVELGRCDEPAMTPVTIMIGTTEASIPVRLLRQVSGTCTGTARTLTRVVDFQPSSSGSWVARLENSSAMVSFTVGAAPNPGCNVNRTPCQADCDCDESIGERCIGVTVGPAATTTCARPCELDRDCAGSGRCTGDVPGGTPFACDTQTECDGSNPCPTGFNCNAGACEPTFTLGTTTRHECACDRDCDPGLRCVRPYDTGPYRCQAMCPTDGPWCAGPGAHACGDMSLDVSGLAGTDAVCGFLGE